MTGPTVLKTAAIAILAIGLSSAADPATSTPQQDATASHFADLANAVRRDAGCPALSWHAGAAQVARRHSNDMSQNKFFSHTNRAGQSPFDRLEDAGLTYRSAAENILQGEATPTRVLELWMASPSHRANILECSFTHHGVGRVQDYWTHVFLQDPARP